MFRDVATIIIISMGIYSHSRTLVNRFIMFEQSQLQQK